MRDFLLNAGLILPVIVAPTLALGQSCLGPPPVSGFTCSPNTMPCCTNALPCQQMADHICGTDPDNAVYVKTAGTWQFKQCIPVGNPTFSCQNISLYPQCCLYKEYYFAGCPSWSYDCDYVTGQCGC